MRVGNGLANLLGFETEMVHPEGVCMMKFICFCSGRIELQCLSSCKSHIHPGFLGLHGTLLCVLKFITHCVVKQTVNGWSPTQADILVDI